MMFKYSFLALSFAMSASPASAQTSKLPYPPADAPLFLDCRLHGMSEQKSFKDSDRLTIFFPNGSNGSLIDIEFVDPNNQIGGEHFNFNIKNETSWSLYNTDKVPASGDSLSELARIVFLPPSGEGETLRVGYAIGRKVQKFGVCFGMIGPDTKGAFERAKAQAKAGSEK